MDVLIQCDYRPEAASLIDVEGLARHVMTSQGAPAQAEVSVSFVTDERIHELNRDFRGIDRSTDVLSFECDGVEDGFAAPEGAEFELGDVVIAPDVAEAQAGAYGMSFADELSLLLVHGMLHLCGYDHLQPDEAEEMEELERELLTSFYGRPFER
ncbi:rRNA maturation RNase YbeY [Eggerthellaceae bacterium zg-1084]|uniref:rRNA maturation RNase YbeY n=1 Tax=Berryella wangjianweii TaxID=2734634 RepID=UPI001553F872|nr:rRNA maturation RNase YbeY [Berryella wangjianweii]NPD30310.1 rRNA maturation RNase YbeY [Berryella wangjianweii]